MTLAILGSSQALVAFIVSDKDHFAASIGIEPASAMKRKMVILYWATIRVRAIPSNSMLVLSAVISIPLGFISI